MAGVTITDSVTLSKALTSALIIPGDTLVLRGGTYSGNFVSGLVGTSDNPIIIKPYLNEKPIIDGSLAINGAYQVWQDIEIMYSGWDTRTSAFTGSEPADIPFTKHVAVSGTGHVCNGLIVHDLAGFAVQTLAVTPKITGCLIYNIGWDATDRGHGHSLYLQNITGRKSVTRCISVNSFGYSWHSYTENGKIDYIDYIETTCINAGAPVQHAYHMFLGGALAIDPHWYRNMTYNCESYMGSATDAILVDNYMVSGFDDGDVTYTTNSGNTITKPASGLVQFCYVDEYHATRGFLTVYNWDLDDTFEADLTNITGLSVGDTVGLRCSEDYHNCYQDLVLDANKKVSIDMRAVIHTVATAIGHDYTPPTTAPEFGCFVVEKV